MKWPLLDDGVLEVTGYMMIKFIGRVRNGSAFLLGYLQRIKVFSGPKIVVISSKKYDIHKLTLNLDTLNKSQVDANMKNWQIYGNLNFCDYILISGFCICL
jgi:hypothetical protein